MVNGFGERGVGGEAWATRRFLADLGSAGGALGSKRAENDGFPPSKPIVAGGRRIAFAHVA